MIVKASIMLLFPLIAICLISQGQAFDWRDYDDVIGKSILFFEAQRSGELPGDNRIDWRGDSALNDGSDVGMDLTGGWYDAGDHVKFGLPMASSATLLAWGIIEFKDAYMAAGQYENAKKQLRWATDYFIKCHVSESDELFVQVGDGHADHSSWGRPEDMTMYRPSMKITRSNPGSDVAGETAAALAAACIVFRETDYSYSETLRVRAQELFELADSYLGIYSNSVPGANDFYRSSGYNDELAFAAAWIYRATGYSFYLNKAREFYSSGTPWALSWDDKNAGVQMMMYQIDKSNTYLYKEDVKRFLDSWMRGGSVHYTPKGLAWRSEWGPLRYSANTALIAAIACKEKIDNYQEYCDFVRTQIDYMLGSSGRSYVIGFGNNPPQRPHHRSSSCPDRPASCDWNNYNYDGPNPQTLTGALVGGPDSNDNYEDRRDDYKSNEVACDYNAGFQSAVAGLRHYLL
ncbi:endoglucanase E-4-like isoform X1 [Lytechinus variegatus]|uniref:endoglucanase E-4-like isoform X1 n=2 Tax=Lytechinus variegatus TaxID=7654 RepID=UPI001BB13F43|nr:endoglucanase E-4-like isoform X1 [Lytechinus variegatus]